MTDDQHGEGTPRTRGRWDPLPQGDYDDGATAFVKLPEGGIDALAVDRLSRRPAAASPGSPPRPGGRPRGDGAPGPRRPRPSGGGAGAGSRAAQAGHQQAAHDGFSYHPGATGQWDFGEAAREGASSGHQPADAPGHDVTGQWSIPVAGGDLPDESGEFAHVGPGRAVGRHAARHAPGRRGGALGDLGDRRAVVRRAARRPPRPEPCGPVEPARHMRAESAAERPDGRAGRSRGS